MPDGDSTSLCQTQSDVKSASDARHLRTASQHERLARPNEAMASIPPSCAATKTMSSSGSCASRRGASADGKAIDTAVIQRVAMAAALSTPGSA